MTASNPLRAVTLPTVPEVTPDNVQDVLQAVKEILDVRFFGVSDPLDRAVTFRSLYENGMATQKTGGGYTLTVPGVTGGVDLSANTTISSNYLTPPAVTGLSATAGLANVILQWDQPTYRNHAYTEVWRNGTDDIGTATRIGTTPGHLYADPVGSTAATRYYWVRAVSQTAIVGPFNAVAGTSATTARVQNADITAGSVTADKISVATLAAVSADMGDLTAGTITLNSTGHIKSGQTGYDTGTGFWLGRDTGTARFSLGDSTGNKLTWDGSTLAITGTLTATAGAAGGWTISSTELYAGSGATKVGMSSASTGADDIRFYAGSATPSLAPFQVTESGAATFSNISVTGGNIDTTGYVFAAGLNAASGSLPLNGGSYNVSSTFYGARASGTAGRVAAGAYFYNSYDSATVPFVAGVVGVITTTQTGTLNSGVLGYAPKGVGVQGYSDGSGGVGVGGTSSHASGIGVYAYNSGGGYALYVNGASYFNTTISGNISGNAATSSSCTGNAATATTASSCSGNSATATTASSCSGNAATVTNGVYTTGSYADPSWITSLAGSKISGNISGNAATATTASSCSGNAATATSATSAGSVTNSVTFTSSGGAAAGTTFNGSAAKTIDYSTVGAASSGHTHSLSSIDSNAVIYQGTTSATTLSGYILLATAGSPGSPVKVAYYT